MKVGDKIKYVTRAVAGGRPTTRKGRVVKEYKYYWLIDSYTPSGCIKDTILKVDLYTGDVDVKLL